MQEKISITESSWIFAGFAQGRKRHGAGGLPTGPMYKLIINADL